MSDLRPTVRQDGTIRLWDACTRAWFDGDPRDVSAVMLALLPADARARVVRAAELRDAEGALALTLERARAAMPDELSMQSSAEDIWNAEQCAKNRKGY